MICQFNILTIAESSAQLLYFIFPFHLFKFFLVCCVCTISLIFLRLLCCSSYFRSVECSRARHNSPVFCENGKILVFLDHFARRRRSTLRFYFWPIMSIFLFDECFRVCLLFDRISKDVGAVSISEIISKRRSFMRDASDRHKSSLISEKFPSSQHYSLAEREIFYGN